MTFAESQPAVCSAPKCSANVVRRIRMSPETWVQGKLAKGVEKDSPCLNGPGQAAGCCSNMTQKVGVHNVHPLGFGFGCTGAGLGRIGEVCGGVAGFQGLAPGSSPTSGTVFSLFRGFSASECGQIVL
jgi:hypothetical protein